MILKTKELELEEGLKKEWIITNGIGGFAASTVIGANTRKYHGLLIAPLNPPSNRHLVLSKLDEGIKIDDKNYELYTNICPNYVSHGYKYQKEFEKDYIPVFKYEVENVIITKKVCMQYGKNTVCVSYKVENGNQKDIKMTLAPVINFRDFHSVNSDKSVQYSQEIEDRKVTVYLSGSSLPIYTNMSDGRYTQFTDNHFNNMLYIEEEKRGLSSIDNHIVPGVYEIDIKANSKKEFYFVCSLEDKIEKVNAKTVINNELKRLNKIVEETGLFDGKNDIVKDCIIASDSFIVSRKETKMYTVIAGYPWFLDWMRDTLISMEGLLFITKRFNIAKEIFLTCIKDLNQGLIPNGYSEREDKPLYNSADASLLLFEQIKKYIKYTGDYDFVKENLYEKLKTIIACYANGIDVDGNNIYLDKDGLIAAGTPYTQNTWMDAKIGDYVVTPRNGKAVEINSLWYNALKIMEELTKKFETKKKSEKYAKMAEICKNSFEEKFYNKRRKCLYDVLGDNKIRPNQLFATALSYQVIDVDSKIAKEMLETVTKKLLMAHGLKTLAKGEPDYVSKYEGDNFRRDLSYHQGITWPWLLGLYFDSLRNMINGAKDKDEKANLKKQLKEFISTTQKTFEKSIKKEGAIGSIAELYDSELPYSPKGAFAQAWSVAEVFRILFHTYIYVKDGEEVF